jgi:hypothetical protein
MNSKLAWGAHTAKMVWQAKTPNWACEQKQQTGLASKNSKLGWVAKTAKWAVKHKPQIELVSKNRKSGW